MIIQHNMMSMNTENSLSKVTNNKNKAMEHLSTGYRINRAADDAAGLAISEELRAQVRGLNRASLNVEDGMSLLNTADAGMQEIHSILDRIRDLCVQSANDTNTDEDRSVIQAEIDQLIKEVDHIGNDTEFNTIKILQGGPAKRTQVGSHLEDFIVYNDHQGVAPLGVECGKRYHLTGTYNLLGGVPDASIASRKVTNGFQLDFKNFDSAKWKALAGAAITFNCTLGCKQEFTIKFNNAPRGISTDTTDAHILQGGTTNNFVLNVGVLDYDDDGSKFVTDILGFIGSMDLNAPGGPPTANTNNVHIGHDNLIGTSNGTDIVIYGESGVRGHGDDGFMYIGLYEELKDIEVPDYDITYDFNVQAGANTDQLIGVELPHIDSETLKMHYINALGGELASKSLEYIDQMIDTVNGHRARIGALYNRFEHAYANNTNSSENQQSAESLIRDANMADEMVAFTTQNILEQAGISMLVQANSLTQGVVNLLQ